jgi:hypothetical protein
MHTEIKFSLKINNTGLFDISTYYKLKNKNEFNIYIPSVLLKQPQYHCRNLHLKLLAPLPPVRYLTGNIGIR